MDPVLLAQSVLTSFLVPLAKDAWDAVREKITKDVSESAAKEASSLARRIRDRVRDAFRANGRGDEFDEFEDTNADDAETEKLRAALVEMLEGDGELRAELEALARKPEPETSRPMAEMVGGVVAAINVGGNVYGGTLTAYDNRAYFGQSDNT
jgi:hypothetical protein